MDFLIVTDVFSKYFLVRKLVNSTSAAVCAEIVNDHKDTRASGLMDYQFKKLNLHFTFCIQELNKLYSIVTVIGIDYC